MATVRVLIVDDQPSVLSYATAVLASNGYEVISAFNGEQALEIVKVPPPVDLIVSDIILPGIQGPDLLEAVKVISPVTAGMLITGYTQLEVRTGIPVLHKPFSPQDLIAKAKQVLAESARLNTALNAARQENLKLLAQSAAVLEETKAIVRGSQEQRESRRKRRPPNTSKTAR